MFSELLLSFILTSTSSVLADDIESCILPPYPKNGIYKVSGEPNVEPGEALDNAYLNITCDPGYNLDGRNIVTCFNGRWSSEIPTCVRFCKLNKHPSVTYHCFSRGSDETRECPGLIPIGGVVNPECKHNYFSPVLLNYMHCLGGDWDYIAVCSPDCGQIQEEQPIDNGKMSPQMVPWHAAIYSKSENTHSQICSGSLVSTTLVISAAHCFWNEDEEQLSTNYVVAVGKLYRPWTAPDEDGVQKSDIRKIKVPVRYRGMLTNYQDDIALVFVSSPFEYKPHVKPVCLDFDFNFEKRQLSAGRGKVPAWDTTLDDKELAALTFLDMTYIPTEECIDRVPVNFRELITADKICGTFENGTLFCKGNSGAGMVLPESERGVNKYYLRGVVGSAPKLEKRCDGRIITFTEVLLHRHFITKFL